MRCECGCGWEGEDEVTQWLVEEAVVMCDRKREADRARDVLARAGQDERLAGMAQRALRGF